MKRSLLAIMVAAVWTLAQGANALAPLDTAVSHGKEPIADETGRIRYIVDLTADAAKPYPSTVSLAIQARFDQRHPANVQNLVAALEGQFGFLHWDMTSWVGNSVTAYLTSDQVASLRTDARVTAVTEDWQVSFSSNPRWNDITYASSQPPYTETSSWGRVAVNGKVSSGSIRVYVIDGGVAWHEDLLNVASRVNASCGTNNSGCPGRAVVGCYPHATHVAGIISAAYGNKGSAGVDANAKLISVDILPNDASPAICSDPLSLAVSSIATGMDYAKWDLVTNDPYHVGIVNISINDPSFQPGAVLFSKMLNLATPVFGSYIYSGAFVVQSAGNNFDNACHYTFNWSGSQHTDDGIMIVGGIDKYGQPVTPDNGGFVSDYAAYQPGSNWGPCVEVWAPAKDIYATWGPLTPWNASNSATWQSQFVTYNNYIFFGGTSMAAPHIAGVAAYLAETQTLGSPAAVEAAVRNLFYSTGQVDVTGRTVWLVRLP